MTAVASAASPPEPRRLAAGEAARLTARVTTLSVAFAAVLTAVKLAAWLHSGSVSMLASTADSALDLVAASATFFAVRYAVAPPDAEHRYGHGKAEAFASLMQAGLVFASAALIAREALGHLVRPEPVSGELLGALVMGASIVATLGLVSVQTWVVKRTRSVAVAGDRAHYAADLASNVAALLGLAAARATGEVRFDAAAGLVVALWLAWGAVGVLRASSHHLMDREVDDADREAILKAATGDPAVIGVHQLRTRASGPFLHVQMHMDLAPEQSLEAAHHVVVMAEQRILKMFPDADIIIHADPHGRAEEHGREFDAEGASTGG